MELIRDDIDWNAYAQDPESHKVRSAVEFVQETIDAFHKRENLKSCARPLWEKAKGKIEFRPGEVSLWAGINGHGKSMMLSQTALDLAAQGERVLLMSFEMLPVRQMQRMSRQAYAGDEPPIAFLKRFHAWTDGRIWIYDHNGSIDWQKVAAVMRYASTKFGITHFIIDSMMKCVQGEDDYNGQKNFVTELCAFAHSRKAHVHLVHHVRKGEHEGKPPGKFDVRGASSIVDQVDNLFIVWRAKSIGRGANALEGKEPTARLICEKQRNGEWEGSFGFWFDLNSMQYLERIDAVPMRYALTATN